MAKSLDYVLVTAASAEDLSKAVTARLAEGWQLYGNPAIAGYANVGSTYCQAVTRESVSTPRPSP